MYISLSVRHRCTRPLVELVKDELSDHLMFFFFYISVYFPLWTIQLTNVLISQIFVVRGVCILHCYFNILLHIVVDRRLLTVCLCSALSTFTERTVALLFFITYHNNAQASSSQTLCFGHNFQSYLLSKCRYKQRWFHSFLLFKH